MWTDAARQAAAAARANKGSLGDRLSTALAPSARSGSLMREATQALAQGNPKSAAVPAHPSTGPRYDREALRNVVGGTRRGPGGTSRGSAVAMDWRRRAKMGA